MKITVEKAIEIYTALQYLGEKDLPVWFKIAKNSQKLEPIIKESDEDKKTIIQKLAKKDESGNPIVKDGMYDFGDKVVEASNILKTIYNREYEVEFLTIKPEEFGTSLPSNIMKTLFGNILED